MIKTKQLAPLLVSAIVAAATAVPVAAGDYMFSGIPTGGLPVGVAIGDVVTLNGGVWTTKVPQAQVPAAISVGATPASASAYGLSAGVYAPIATGVAAAYGSASAGSAGTAGIVPAPGINQQGSFLLGGQSKWSGLLNMIEASNAITITSNITSGPVDLFGSTNTGSIVIGGGLTGGVLVLGGAGSAGGIFLTTGTGPINIGVNVGTRSVSMGSVTATSQTLINAGTNGVSIGGAAGTPILIGSAVTTAAINVGTSLTSGALGIGGAAQTGGITIQTGTGPINIGTNAVAKTISVGNITGATGLNLGAGTGGVLIGGAAATPVTIGNNVTTAAISMGAQLTTGTITIGGTAQTGALSIQTGTSPINIGTNATAKTITLGNTTGATAVAINAGTGGINLGGPTAVPITIGNATGTTGVNINAGSGGIQIGTFGATVAISIGSGAAATGVSIAAGSGGILLGTTNATIAMQSGTGAINIGADAFAKTITIGNTTGTTAVNYKSGTGLHVFNGPTNTAASAISIGNGDAAAGAWLRNDANATVLATKVGSLYLGFAGALQPLNLMAGGTAIQHTFNVDGSITLAIGSTGMSTIGTLAGAGAAGLNVNVGSGGFRVTGQGVGMPAADVNIGDQILSGNFSFGGMVGTGSVNIAPSLTAGSVTIGGPTQTGLFDIRSGSGGIRLNTTSFVKSKAPVQIDVSDAANGDNSFAMKIFNTGAGAFSRAGMFFGNGTAINSNSGQGFISGGMAPLALATNMMSFGLNDPTVPSIYQVPFAIVYNNNGGGIISHQVLPGQTDDVVWLGSPSTRWKVIYCVNPVINTSDITKKRDRVALLPKEAGEFVDFAAEHAITYGWVDRPDETRRYSGLSAQGIRTKYPDKVDGEKEGELGIGYTGMIAELLVTVADLRARVSQLETAA
jgi:hypothetical protein